MRSRMRRNTPAMERHPIVTDLATTGGLPGRSDADGVALGWLWDG